MAEPRMPGPLATMREEVALLAGDMRALLGHAARDSWPMLSALAGRARRVVFTGCGDSLIACEIAQDFAGEVAGAAAADIAMVRPRMVSAFAARQGDLSDTLFIGVSASGGTPPVLAGLEAAKAKGALTLSVTGKPDAALPALTDEALVMALEEKKPSPGIRSFQASLLGLVLFVLAFGRRRGGLAEEEAEAWLSALADNANATEASAELAASFAVTAAQLSARAPVLLVIGEGPGLPMARFGAAKRIEASGAFAAAQDAEEVWHIERFAAPEAFACLVIEGPGGSPATERAAAIAAGLGRELTVMSPEGPSRAAAHASCSLHYAPTARAALAPFCQIPMLALIAAEEALILGRLPFGQDRPKIGAELKAYLSEDRS